jgi:surface carbohydrate biosynthesis protein
VPEAIGLGLFCESARGQVSLEQVLEFLYSRKMERSAILPCEIKSREFEAKLLLACVLAERGWHAVLGSRNHIHLRLQSFPVSVYLGKDVRHSSRKIAFMVKSLGHRFVAMDEEAQFYLSRERYRISRVDSYVLKSAETLFAWGEDNSLAWQEAIAYRQQPIFLTGNGRTDLLRPETRKMHANETNEIRSKYGKFVLINTNFGAINPFMTSLTPTNTTAAALQPFQTGYLAHRKEIFDAFVSLLPRLSQRFPGCKFILRPHPGENIDFWRQVTACHENILVESSGNIVPWILASSAVIHNACTTGLEAYLLERIPIAYQPVISEDYDLKLPNSLSFSASSELELYSTLERVLRGELGHAELRTAERQAFLEGHISATSGNLASDRIADAIENLWTERGAGGTSPWYWLLGTIFSVARAGVKKFNMNRPGHKSNIGYTLHRFPSTSILEVNERISDFRSCLGRFSGVVAHQLDENIFSVQKGNETECPGENATHENTRTGGN